MSSSRCDRSWLPATCVDHDVPMSSKAVSAKRFPSLSVDDESVRQMVDKLFLFYGASSRTKLSAFWVLMALSSIIATAGVMTDSTATVIGAMIVAPLMTPILGTALSVVVSDRGLIIRNVLVVAAGAIVAVGIAYVMGLVSHVTLNSQTNTQIAGRISPTLLDLVAALATGAVGAFATVRSDVSNTLPGVAIAISLVPPLSVVGLTLQSGSVDEAMGALLLWTTNVSAIVATGTLIFLLYGVRPAARRSGFPVGRLRRSTVAVVIGAVAIISVPLGAGSTVVVQQELTIAHAAPIAKEWAADQDWEISQIYLRHGTLVIVAIGQPPVANETGLRDKLDAAGLQDVDAKLTLLYGGSKDLPHR